MTDNIHRNVAKIVEYLENGDVTVVSSEIATGQEEYANGYAELHLSVMVDAYNDMDITEHRLDGAKPEEAPDTERDENGDPKVLK